MLPAPSKQGWGRGQDLSQLLAGTVCSPKLQQDGPEELPLQAALGEAVLLKTFPP